MTFEEFQASRTNHDDIRLALPDWTWEDGATLAPRGWVYAGQLCIEMITDAWPEESRKAGKLYLQLGNEEFIADDLELLERRLYHYARAEGLA